MKRVKVLWFVEHKARELDVACAVKCLAEERYPVEVSVRNIYLHAREILDAPAPQVVVHPFFYHAEGALGTQHYVRAWPRALHFNLAWEELFYASNARIKGPSDDFARLRVLHHAWGDFYRSFLVRHGVPPDHIVVNGNPAYQLYRTPYSRIAPSRQALAERFGLDPAARWLFIPENYRWAFTTDHKLRRIAASDEHYGELLGMKDHCIRSLETLLGWCREASSRPGVEIILRPRPATNSRHMLEFCQARQGDLPSHFHVIKEGSVREWILASDVVLSSFSTSLIEAAIAGKPIYMIEPLPLPEGLSSSWYQHVDRTRELDDFLRAASREDRGGSPGALREWAQTELLARGDPIENLADLVGKLARSDQRLAPLPPPVGLLGRLRERRSSRLACAEGKSAIDMNRDTHEGDEFTEEDVQKRVATWRSILLADHS